MGRIQSNIGLTTGIDIQSTVDKLVAVSAQPRDRLQARIKSFQSQQVAVNELTALLIGVQLQTDKLGKVANLTSTTASSNKTDVLTVTASGTPTTGSYAVRVLQTAQTATASSAAFTSTSDTLSAGDFVVRTGGFVDSSSSLDELRGGAGIARGKISITDRSGTTREVDLRFAVNTDDVVKAINSTADLKVTAKISGDRIVLSDLTGQTTSNLVVAEVGDGRTAADLGLGGINVAANSATGEDLAFLGSSTRLSTLKDNRGIAFYSGKDLTVTLKDGTSLDIDVNSTSTPNSVGQLITAINAANSSKLEARIASSGNGIELIDKTSGSNSFTATGSLADQLGFTGVNGSSGTIEGARIQSTLQGPLLSALKGGKGIGTPGSISITNRAGTVTNVNLSGSISLRDIIDKVNSANAGVTASLNQSRTGIVLQDVTGSTASNLIIANGDANNTATALNIVANTSNTSVDSKSLGTQYVGEATALSKLNQGRGVRLGSFTITNSAGAQSAVNLAQTGAKTVGDVLKAINATNIGIEAKLNDNGDGIVLVDTSGGTGTLTITDGQNSNAALDLGIRGTGTSYTSPTRQEINGSQTFKLTLTGTETLSQVVDKINNSNGPLTASILTSGPSTVRLLLSSRASGEAGRIVAEGDAVGLNINSSGIARDAIVAVGAAGEYGGTLVRSSSNTFDNAINGLSLTVKGTSADPVDIQVASSTTNIEKNLQLFVDQFNKVRDKIAKETAFDATTKVTGQLFGSQETLRVDQAMARFINHRSFSSGKIQSLEQLGISLDDKGKLQFDKEKLSTALATNLDDVKKYFTEEKTGFAVRAKSVLEKLVGVKDSVLVARSQTLQRNIDAANLRVDSLTVKLDREKERLLNQFYAMESNIAKIKNSANSIGSLAYIGSNA